MKTNLSSCINLFRGVLHFEEGKEVMTRRGIEFTARFSAHGKRVVVHRRSDGVLFVNAAGRTALVTSQLSDNLKRAVAEALRR